MVFAAVILTLCEGGLSSSAALEVAVHSFVQVRLVHLNIMISLIEGCYSLLLPLRPCP